MQWSRMAAAVMAVSVWGGVSVEGEGEVAAGFGQQVAEAAAVVDRDDRGDLQSCGRDINDGANGGADHCGSEADQAQEVIDDRLAGADNGAVRQRARNAGRG